MRIAIREYQVLLFRDCKLSPGTIEGRTAALRFLFVKTLSRNLLFDFKHGGNDTPISLVRDIVKRFSSGDPPNSPW